MVHVFLHLPILLLLVLRPGGSFFSWDDGNMERMLSYKSVIGYKNLVGVGRAQSKALAPPFCRHANLAGA
jgi:hypothetical protein